MTRGFNLIGVSCAFGITGVLLSAQSASQLPAATHPPTLHSQSITVPHWEGTPPASLGVRQWGELGLALCRSPIPAILAIPTGTVVARPSPSFDSSHATHFAHLAEKVGWHALSLDSRRRIVDPVCAYSADPRSSGDDGIMGRTAYASRCSHQSSGPNATTSEHRRPTVSGRLCYRVDGNIPRYRQNGVWTRHHVSVPIIRTRNGGQSTVDDVGTSHPSDSRQSSGMESCRSRARHHSHLAGESVRDTVPITTLSLGQPLECARTVETERVHSPPKGCRSGYRKKPAS